MTKVQKDRILPLAQRFLGLTLSLSLVAACPGLEPYRIWASEISSQFSIENQAVPLVIQPANSLFNLLGNAFATQGQQLSLGKIINPDRGTGRFRRSEVGQIRQILSRDNWKKLKQVLAQVQAGSTQKIDVPQPLNPSPKITNEVSARAAIAALVTVNRALDRVTLEQLHNPETMHLVIGQLVDGYGQWQRAGEVSRKDSKSDVEIPILEQGINTASPLSEAVFIQAAKLKKFVEKKGELERLNSITEFGSEKGEEDYQRKINKDLIDITESEIGKAKITMVDNIPFVRVVTTLSDDAILFMDRAVSEQSKHLRQIIARQFFDSGSDRKDKKTGRNVWILWSEGDAILKTEYRGKPVRLSREWWRNWWYATFKMPTWGDFIFSGLGMGVFLQGVFSLIMSVYSKPGGKLLLSVVYNSFLQGHLLVPLILLTTIFIARNKISKKWPALQWLSNQQFVKFMTIALLALWGIHSLPGLLELWKLFLTHWDWPILFTMGYGGLIGTFKRSYLNWNYRGNPSRQFWKGWVNSSIFGIPFTLLRFGPASLSPLCLAGWIGIGALALNIALNLQGKVSLQQFSKMIRENNRATDQLPLNLSRDAVIDQVLYYLLWIPRIADLEKIRHAKLMFALFYPISRVLTYAYALCHPRLKGADEIIQDLKGKWEFIKGSPRHPIKHILVILRSIYNVVYTLVKELVVEIHEGISAIKEYHASKKI